MRRGITYILMLAALMALAPLAAGCGEAVEEDPYAGYSMAGPLEGGSPLEEANARALSITGREGGTHIELSFNVGSRMSGGGEESGADVTPAYRIYTLRYPDRLAVEFESLPYSDYEREEPVSGGMVLAAFTHRMEGQEGAAIYFQLSGPAAFKVQAGGGTLQIELKPMAEPEEEEERRYIVTADAYRDYCGGKLAVAGMTPTLDSSLSHVLLVSEAFDSDIEAEHYANTVVADNISAVREEWSVIPAQAGKLPAYDEKMAYGAAYSEAVLRVGGEALAAEVFIPDGWYLADVPRRLGGGALYGKRMIVESIDDEYQCEMLYIRHSSGDSGEYLSHEFETIESAAFSPDGRKLAVLERAAETANLYIFDLETEELLVNLADMGFGDIISAYTWDDLGTTLYAVSGPGAMQVHQYDFNVPVEGKRHSVVEKNGADEGCIAYCDGSVYFIHSDMESGDQIYRVKCDGGVRRNFTYGSVFALSADDAYMAINAESGVAASVEGSVKFRLYDMESGESRPINDGFGVQDFIWSRDCTRVYYFENRLSGSGGEGDAEDAAPGIPQDGYPYTLWVYDVESGENRAVADFPETAIFPGEGRGVIYLNYSDAETMGDRVRATYAIDVEGLG